MLNPGEFHELISGRQRGFGPSVKRGVLACAEIPYTVAVVLRNQAFDRGWKTIQRAEIPVVSVGNLTTGGTGKTPVVAWLARWFRRHGARVALLSRGYRAEEGARNDEALELELQLPDVPHLQNPDRVAGARTAVEECRAQVLLLDDAFQHRRLARDLDIVLLDALEPFGYEHLLPRGLLREPMAGLRRAQVVALSRADLIDGSRRAAIWQRVRRCNATALQMEIGFRPSGLVGPKGIECLSTDKTIAAFCGIGNPDGFRGTLEQCGLRLAAFRSFPDHHPYSREDLADLTNWVAPLEQVELVVCTRKDWVKLNTNCLGRHPLRALAIEAQVLSGESEFEAVLRERILEPALKPPA